MKHGFLKKLKKLLKERAVPEKYVCALALSVGGDVDDELLTEVRQFLLFCTLRFLSANN